jgi:NarL family two-component system response regulator LiaR
VSQTIRVVIVDDHAVVREGLRNFLELQDGIEVAGEAENGLEAVDRVQELKPDVVLMDLVMPDCDGLDAMRELRRRGSPARVLVLTSFLDDERVLPAIEAGAAGYLLKNVAPAELARAVRAAHAGEAILDPGVAARLVEWIARPERAPTSNLEQLTRREREVLGQIVEGRSNKQIARELGVAEKTVKTHVGHLLAKLGVTDRTQAALLAVREGLGGPRT